MEIGKDVIDGASSLQDRGPSVASLDGGCIHFEESCSPFHQGSWLLRDRTYRAELGL